MLLLDSFFSLVDISFHTFAVCRHQFFSVCPYQPRIISCVNKHALSNLKSVLHLISTISSLSTLHRFHFSVFYMARPQKQNTTTHTIATKIVSKKNQTTNAERKREREKNKARFLVLTTFFISPPTK